MVVLVGIYVLTAYKHPPTHTLTHTHTLVGGHVNFSKNTTLSLLLKTARCLCSILILAVFFFAIWKGDLLPSPVPAWPLKPGTIHYLSDGQKNACTTLK